MKQIFAGLCLLSVIGCNSSDAPSALCMVQGARWNAPSALWDGLEACRCFPATSRLHGQAPARQPGRRRHEPSARARRRGRAQPDVAVAGHASEWLGPYRPPKDASRGA